MSQTDNTPSATDSRLDNVLRLATSTAKGELGSNATNKKVSAAASLTTRVTENGKTTRDAVNASVSLGVSRSEEEAEAEAEPEC